MHINTLQFTLRVIVKKTSKDHTKNADNYPVAHFCLVTLVVLMGVASTMGIVHLISSWDLPKPANYFVMSVVGGIAFLL